MLKELIKKLSAEQTALKQARKTGPQLNPHLGLLWSEACARSHVAASAVRNNRLKITAALNLRHEVWGSDYRHGVAKIDESAYVRHWNELFHQVVACIAKGDYVG
jgi:hypothetical protein